MGRSYTYHVVTADIGPVHGAMNGLEMAQLEKRFGKREWMAQTVTGERILAAAPTRTIRCVCPNGCPACQFSTITTRRWLNGYQAWQLEGFAVYGTAR